MVPPGNPVRAHPAVAGRREPPREEDASVVRRHAAEVGPSHPRGPAPAGHQPAEHPPALPRAFWRRPPAGGLLGGAPRPHVQVGGRTPEAAPSQLPEEDVLGLLCAPSPQPDPRQPLHESAAIPRCTGGRCFTKPRFSAYSDFRLTAPPQGISISLSVGVSPVPGKGGSGKGAAMGAGKA